MNTLTFVSWNVNGIRAVDKKEALKWMGESEYLFIHRHLACA
jgi:exodeoxyribonuclease-3